MAIVQRCQNRECRIFFGPREGDCPKCHLAAKKDARVFYFRRKVKVDGRVKLLKKRSPARTFKEAELLHARWLSQEVDAAPSTSSPVSFRQVADTYLRKLQVEGKVYHRLAKLFLSRMEKTWGEDVLAAEITVEMVREFQVALREGGASPAYCDRHLAIGKAAFSYTLPDMPNPFKRVKMYHPDNTLIRTLSPKEEAALLEAAKTCHPNSPKYFYEMLVVALNTGMRESNVLRLHINEVDFRTKKISLKQKRDLSFETYMNSTVVAALKQVKPNEAGWFFPNPATGKPYTRFDKTFAALKRRAKIKRAFRWHDLRHHFGSVIARNTGNVILVQKLLGHRNIATSMRYVHQFGGELRKALEDLASEEGSPTGIPR